MSVYFQTIWNSIDTRKKLFGATYMTMNNEFYKIVNNQIRMQVEKNGDQMITLDPALDQKKQNEQIKQLVKRKVDAIFSKSSRLESSRTRTCRLQRKRRFP